MAVGDNKNWDCPPTYLLFTYTKEPFEFKLLSFMDVLKEALGVGNQNKESIVGDWQNSCECMMSDEEVEMAD